MLDVGVWSFSIAVEVISSVYLFWILLTMSSVTALMIFVAWSGILESNVVVMRRSAKVLKS